jgi:hypothetical protein
VSSQVIGTLIALGLGIWAYRDAKALEERGVKVGRFSPVAWGIGVALVAILFGVLYLRQRGRAVRMARGSAPATNDAYWASEVPSPPAGNGHERDTPERDARERARFCRSCGHELPPYVASFCPKCGRQL